MISASHSLTHPSIVSAQCSLCTAHARSLTRRSHMTQSLMHSFFVWSRYGPKMTEGQNAYRWFSSLLLYNDFVQLGSNLLLFLALGVHLERRFGTRRLLILTMIAGVGGNFFSAAFEVISSRTHQAASMLSCLSHIKCNSKSCSPPHKN